MVILFVCIAVFLTRGDVTLVRRTANSCQINAPDCFDSVLAEHGVDPFPQGTHTPVLYAAHPGTKSSVVRLIESRQLDTGAALISEASKSDKLG
jgi:hypothetical protein